RVVCQGLRVRLGKEEATLGAPVPLKVRVEAAALLRRNEEVGHAERGLHLTGERIGVVRVVGTVLRADVTAQGDAPANELAEPEPTVDEVLRKGVGRILPEDHVRVAARGK